MPSSRAALPCCAVLCTFLCPACPAASLLGSPHTQPTCHTQLIILDAHSRKQAEQAGFQAALSAALAERDTEGRALVDTYDKVHKHLMRQGAAATAAAGQQLPGTEEQVGGWEQGRLGRAAAGAGKGRPEKAGPPCCGAVNVTVKKPGASPVAPDHHDVVNDVVNHDVVNDLPRPALTPVSNCNLM